MTSRRQRDAKIELYAIVKSTPLESNKSLSDDIGKPILSATDDIRRPGPEAHGPGAHQAHPHPRQGLVWWRRSNYFACWPRTPSSVSYQEGVCARPAKFEAEEPPKATVMQLLRSEAPCFFVSNFGGAAYSTHTVQATPPGNSRVMVLMHFRFAMNLTKP